MKFNSNILTFIIDCFIKQFTQQNNTYLVSLASIIERKYVRKRSINSFCFSLKRYPIDFDDNIRQQTEKCSTNEERKRIREFASMTAIGFKHQVRSNLSNLFNYSSLAFIGSWFTCHLS